MGAPNISIATDPGYIPLDTAVTTAATRYVLSHCPDAASILDALGLTPGAAS